LHIIPEGKIYVNRVGGLGEGWCRYCPGLEGGRIFFKAESS
jgi:hypothetical protein